jgi:RNA polymerase sigma-70 factor (ECF subfamily)
MDAVRLDRFLASVEQRALLMARLDGRGEEALDVVQEAMFRFARRYASRPEAEWKPLFWKVLRNAMVDDHRRKAVRNRFTAWLGLGSRDEDNSPDPVQTLPDRADTRETAEREAFMGDLERELRSLPARQREAFLLRTWEGLDTAQTAAAMGCSQGSVKTHHHRALTALRQRLKEHWP